MCIVLSYLIRILGLVGIDLLLGCWVALILDKREDCSSKGECTVTAGLSGWLDELGRQVQHGEAQQRQQQAPSSWLEHG